MSLQTIRTIQSGVQTSYSDRYIKQALSNLGQRVGAKGDSITNKTFTIRDIADSDALANLIRNYVCLKYNVTNNTIHFISDSNSITDTNVIAVYSDEGVVNINKIDILESLTTWNNYSNVQIIKNHNQNINNETGVYFINGICKNNTTPEAILSLEFSENDNIINKAVYITTLNNKIRYYIATQDDDTIQILDNKVYEIVSNNLSLDYIYTLVNSSTSVDTIISSLNSSNGNNVVSSTLTDGDLQNVLNIFTYAASVLPKYIKEEYNKAKYFSDNSYKEFKKAILYKFAQQLFIDSNIVGTTFDIYIPADYIFSYIGNSNTNAIYTSYDINVQYDINIQNTELDNIAYILAESQGDTKVVSYKFIVSYLDSEEYVDQISIHKNYTLPYIKSIDDVTYWVIDDKVTDIPTSGENAGNPNIMMISYSSIEIPGSVAYSDENSTYINILHTYDEEVGETSYKQLLKDSIENAPYSEFKYTTGISIGTENTYNFRIKLPDINAVISENILFERIIKNTLLMTFVDLKLEYHDEDDTRLTLQEQLHGSSGSSSYITVYWHIEYNYQTGKYSWTPILNPLYSDEDTAPVLDLGAMLSMKDFIDYYSNTLYSPDKYVHRWIVFNEATGILKNTPPVTGKKKIFPIFKNDPSSYYISDDTEPYTNNLNFVPKFLFDKYNSGDNTLDTILKDQNGIGITTIYDNQNYNNVSNKLFNFTIGHGAQGNSSYYKASKYVKINTIDYIPNAIETDNIQQNYPMFDFREVLTINQTAMNRLSLLMTEDDGSMYHAFIGYSGRDKRNVLTIGTDKTNYNMSTNITLTNTFENFKTLDTLKVAMPMVTDHEFISDGLSFIKSAGNIYYAIVTADQTDDAIYFETGEKSEISSAIMTPYMSEVEITEKSFNAKAYVASKLNNTCLVAPEEDIKCKLFMNTDSEGNGYGPSKLMFILHFSKTSGDSYPVKLQLIDCKQIVTTDIISIY